MWTAGWFTVGLLSPELVMRTEHGDCNDFRGSGGTSSLDAALGQAEIHASTS